MTEAKGSKAAILVIGGLILVPLGAGAAFVLFEEPTRREVSPDADLHRDPSADEAARPKSSETIGHLATTERVRPAAPSRPTMSAGDLSLEGDDGEEGAETPAEIEQRLAEERAAEGSLNARTERIERNEANYTARDTRFAEELEAGRLNPSAKDALLQKLDQTAPAFGKLETKREVRCTDSVCEITMASDVPLGRALASWSSTLAALPGHAVRSLPAEPSAPESPEAEPGVAQASRIRILVDRGDVTEGEEPPPSDSAN